MKLSDKIDAIALGESYSTDALMQAMHHPIITSNDSQVINRYLWGTQKSTDHMKLQQIAIDIRLYGE